MKKCLSIVMVATFLLSQPAFAVFSDVDSSDYNLNEALEWLERNGVVQGYADGTFRPDTIVNRAEFLKMLYEAKGGLSDLSGDEFDLPFTDIPAGDVWYKPYVAQAYRDGVVNGYPDGTFRPEAKINWAEALKMVMEAFLYVDKLYGDGSGDEYYELYDDGDIDGSYCTHWRADDDGVDVDAWYWKYLCVADGLSLIGFRGRADINPSHDLWRGWMAQLLYRSKAVADNPNGLVHFDYLIRDYGYSVQLPLDPGAAPALVCAYNGQDYYHGDLFAADDDCNECTCDGRGYVYCTQKDECSVGNETEIENFFIDSFSSSAFNDSGEILLKYTCDGENVSPSLQFSGVPEVVESLVLIFDDFDIYTGVALGHWIVWNIEPDITQILEGVAPSGAREGLNRFGTVGYGGPCPPPGEEGYYVFRLKALDVVLDLQSGATIEELNKAIEGHVITESVLGGEYGR